MSVLSQFLYVVSFVAAGALACSGALLLVHRLEKKKRRESVLDLWDATQMKDQSEDAATCRNRGILSLKQLTQELFCGSTQPLALSVRSNRSSKTPAGVWFQKRSTWAGCSHEVSPSAFCEAAFRSGLLGCAAGCFVGLLFSTQFAVLLAVVGFFLGYFAPFRAVRKAVDERASEAELHLSEMLQIVSLGLRSGLTFDRSFALYGLYFDNGFSRSCTQTCRRWSLGLSSREESLKEFSASYKCDQLAHVVDSILRSLRFGSGLASTLEEASAQARAKYRANLEERVAKAPVKMMLPTGTLILPAMLLLVLGPVLLELIQGF